MKKSFIVHCTWFVKKNPSQSIAPGCWRNPSESVHLGAEQILQNPCIWCCCCEEMPSCNWVQKKSFRICAPRCCGEEFFSESRCTWVLFCSNPSKVHEQQVLGSEWIVAIRAHKLELVHEESLRVWGSRLCGTYPSSNALWIIGTALTCARFHVGVESRSNLLRSLWHAAAAAAAAAPALLTSCCE